MCVCVSSGIFDSLLGKLQIQVYRQLLPVMVLGINGGVAADIAFTMHRDRSRYGNTLVARKMTKKKG